MYLNLVKAVYIVVNIRPIDKLFNDFSVPQIVRGNPTNYKKSLCFCK